MLNMYIYDLFFAFISQLISFAQLQVANASSIIAYYKDADDYTLQNHQVHE